MQDRLASARIYDDVEPVEEYRPGGYHPVLLGDILDSWYNGPHIDTLPRNSSYVAVKILKAEASISEGPIELTNALYHLGAQHVVQILDLFTYEGLNGTHLCLMFLVSKILCNIIYSGNIIFAVSAADIDNALSQPGTTLCDVNALRHLYVPEPIIDCSLIDGQPGHEVMVVITDLGGALRALELISGRSNISDVRTDFWNLACLIFELICGELLFCLSIFGLLSEQIDEEHWQMVEDITAISEFAVYLDMRTQGRLGDDVLPLARLLRQSMLVEPEHWKNAFQLLTDPWFKAI
ncbi:hypothetical protein V8F44DRAFT_635970 [Aspergillus fumigatus]